MNVQVRFFAGAKEIVGAEQVTVELNNPSTIGDLRAKLAELYKKLHPMASSLLFAIRTDYVTNSVVIEPDSEVVCFPPVSGG
jgi:molybdopterin synthase sulfur carrier subunit